MIVVRSDGAYTIDHANGGRVPGVAVVNPDGSVTIHVPARDVRVEAPIDPAAAYDCSDVDVCRIAVREGRLSIETVRAIRPATADEIERVR